MDAPHLGVARFYPSRQLRKILARILQLAAKPSGGRPPGKKGFVSKRSLAPIPPTHLCTLCGKQIGPDADSFLCANMMQKSSSDIVQTISSRALATFRMASSGLSSCAISCLTRNLRPVFSMALSGIVSIIKNSTIHLQARHVVSLSNFVPIRHGFVARCSTSSDVGGFRGGCVWLVALL